MELFLLLKKPQGKPPHLISVYMFYFSRDRTSSPIPFKKKPKRYKGWMFY
ncbi:hypothetical protein CWATWH8502_4828 [Crocosphaera watsonii WH 8502]|uniref:Uncharacterized protein n=5 Tax=Crocosphaera watsonii TaxID=263511 RepID=T2JPL7_CROWT|nr:hypothetical protein CWATWH0003_0946 [Crocosphaera watsonii WH 0003]CCQ52496.1 hypothetical protein CWATWH8502_4828 [Crocosphaera watsonii WH 8502]CCQ54979.1 hypothetical protein CWATWH0005_4784 [Crocosphaera watsonii WH 0005]CCQ64275.1 hypothetical protein CWATWH0401_3701 [Crocosphaera watsonii WH 0401]CCQ67160.1 hypothetical protein CWATWH0402_3176 [Crocosphaera watsonii WH 0402]